ncbi:MAG: C40 family peptidase, partial [Mycobacteriales bacterium]
GGSTGAATVAPASAPPQRAPLGAAGSRLPLGQLPAPVLSAYLAAASEVNAVEPGCHLPWSLLAGIGYVESDNAAGGGSTSNGWNGVASPPIFGPKLDGSNGTPAIPNTDPALDGPGRWARAMGPMQFLPATWAKYAGAANPQNIDYSALAAARYLCASAGNLTDPAQAAAALFAYNHASWYVQTVLSDAAFYAGAGQPTAVGAPTTFVGAPAPSLGAPVSAPKHPSTPAQLALAYAFSQLGAPYLWGGTGPEFDCSGLTQAAYAHAGIALPRTSEQQWLSVPPVIGPLEPGDLVFFDPGEFSPGLPGHVGIYAGDGYMIDAPHAGAAVRLDSVAGFGQYLGAARPSALLVAPPAVPKPTTHKEPVDPSKTHPSKTHPTPDPTQTQPTKTHPTKTHPTPDPTQTQPTKTQPTKTQPAPDPTQTQPTKTHPTKTHPAPDPTQTQPSAPAPPTNSEPTSAPPAQSPPAPADPTSYQLQVGTAQTITLVPVTGQTSSVPTAEVEIKLPAPGAPPAAKVIEVGAAPPAALANLFDRAAGKAPELTLSTGGQEVRYRLRATAPKTTPAVNDLLISWTAPDGSVVEITAVPEPS